MSKISYAVKIELDLIEKIRTFCLEHGVKQGFFVEKALKEQLQREELLEDLKDFKVLQSHEKDSIAFDQYLKRRK